jgi:hypothetical protein
MSCELRAKKEVGGMWLIDIADFDQFEEESLQLDVSKNRYAELRWILIQTFISLELPKPIIRLLNIKNKRLCY